MRAASLCRGYWGGEEPYTAGGWFLRATWPRWPTTATSPSGAADRADHHGWSQRVSGRGGGGAGPSSGGRRGGRGRRALRASGVKRWWHSWWAARPRRRLAPGPGRVGVGAVQAPTPGTAGPGLPRNAMGKVVARSCDDPVPGRAAFRGRLVPEQGGLGPCKDGLVRCGGWSAGAWGSVIAWRRSSCSRRWGRTGRRR